MSVNFQFIELLTQLKITQMWYNAGATCDSVMGMSSIIYFFGGEVCVIYMISIIRNNALITLIGIVLF